MAVNRGKKFETVIKECFEKVKNVSVDRLHDQTNGYLGSSNICDFIVYKKPYEYYIECKTVHGNTFPFSNLSKNQRLGLSNKCGISGVCAGVIIWWVDKDVTRFVPIEAIQFEQMLGKKSLRYDGKYSHIMIKGRKKRVFFDYDMEKFFKEVEDNGWTS